MVTREKEARSSSGDPESQQARENADRLIGSSGPEHPPVLPSSHYGHVEGKQRRSGAS